MNREKVVGDVLDRLSITLQAAFNEEQIARLLVGYLASCELYVRDRHDGDGRLPNGVLVYHNEAKRILGLTDIGGNGTG